jgi:hypothetical protein
LGQSTLFKTAPEPSAGQHPTATNLFIKVDITTLLCASLGQLT